MDDERAETPNERNAVDETASTTARTGAGGESDARVDADTGMLTGQDDLIEADETVAGSSSGGGSGPGFVAPPPGTDWPDPFGGDDDDRELERRTR